MASEAIANQIFRQLRNDRGTTEVATYVAVPGNEMARWLLPAAVPEIARVLASWAPYRWWSRVGWAAVRAANRMGRVGRIPGVSMLEVEGTCGADWTSLGWQLSEPPIPVIYVGTPGCKRKAVVHLVERATGRCKAVVKVPLTQEAKTAVMHEAAVLDALARENCELSPRLLHVDRVRAISTQTFVEGRPGARKLTPEFWAVLHSLLLPGETTSLEEHWQKWAGMIASQNDAGDESGSGMEAIEGLRDQALLPACWEHGDFTPWNIKGLPSGGCALLDWEDAERKRLPLQDAYHFLHMQDFLFEGRPTIHAAKVEPEARRMGIEPKQCRNLEVAYLIGAYLKCVNLRDRDRTRFLRSTLGLHRRSTA